MDAGLLVQAGCVAEQAAFLGSIRQGDQVGLVRADGRGRPEGSRWDLLAASPAAVLVEIVGQLPGRRAAQASRGAGCRAGPVRCQRPADPLAGLAV
jgi:hypothetical protein